MNKKTEFDAESHVDSESVYNLDHN